MAFYIKPPKGIISRRKLQKYAEKRFRFLADLINCKDDNEKLAELLTQTSTIDGSECLITGSQCDRISHFVVRLALCDSPARAEWFVKAEVTLFKIRLDAQTTDEKEQCLTDAQHQIIKFSSFQPYSYRKILLTLKSICKSLKNREDTNSFIKVPFEHALTFVRRRELPLQNGQVIVPMQKIRDLLSSVHELILYEGIQQMRSSNCSINAMSDSRIKDIANQLQCHSNYQVQPDKPPGIILAKNVDNASKQFPPCMLHLYRILKHRHRLQHSARIQLTLFLKDIGMPLNEALVFWENEYSIPAACQASCSHSWSKEKRRYIYNIRHLYGEEGSRRNYKSQSCSALQDGLIGVGHEGGCPFAQFDIENIGNIILADNIKEQQASEIIQCVQQKKYKEACLHYLLAQFLKKSDISPISCNSISTKTDKCDNGSKILFYYERIYMDLALGNNDILECHNISISNTSVIHSSPKKTSVNIQKLTTEDECHLSEPSHDCQVHRKVIYPSLIRKPVDYFKSFQLLLKGIRESTV